MSWSFSIGRLFGSDLKVHVTFLILLGYIAFSAYVAAGPAAAIWNTVFILALFACVVAHEFGHALAARRYGIKTPDVTLLPIGGLARLDRMPERPSEEIVVALAGPAVNVVIWLILTVIFGASADLSIVTGTDAGSAGFLDQLATVNLYLLAFNLLPAFPMDGGRVLRALLAMRLGRPVGTAVAARIGQAMAVLFGLYGMMIGNPFLLLIAAFVFFAAQSESTEAAFTDIAAHRRAMDAMITEFRALNPDDTLSVAADAIVRTTQHEFPVTDITGRPVGFLPRQAVFRAVAEGKTDQRVADLMEMAVPSVGPRAPLTDAMRLMAESPQAAVLVQSVEGRLLGYITRENMGELMLVAHAARGR